MSVVGPSPSQLQIDVKQANKREEEFLNSGYIDYTISAICNHPAFPAGYFTVERRYSDFAWLRDEMGKDYPGLIIPALPEKQILGTFEQQFIEARKRGIQKFLNKVAANDTLVKDAKFISFLTATEKEFGGLRLASEQDKQESMATQLTSWFDQTYNSVFDTFTGVTPAEVAKVAPCESEGEIEKCSQYLDRLDDYVKKLIVKAQEKLTMDTQLAQSSTAFGNSFLQLSGKQHGLAAASFGQIGQRACRSGEIGDSMVVNEEEHFMEPFKEFHLYILSAKETVQRRENIKKLYIEAVKDLNTCAARVDDPAKPGEKQATVEAAKARVESTHKDFEDVTAIFLREFSAFQSDSRGDVIKAMFNFVRLQADYHKRCGTAWDEYQDNQYVAVPVHAEGSCSLS